VTQASICSSAQHPCAAGPRVGLAPAARAREPEKPEVVLRIDEQALRTQIAMDHARLVQTLDELRQPKRGLRARGRSARAAGCGSPTRSSRQAGGSSRRLFRPESPSLPPANEPLAVQAWLKGGESARHHSELISRAPQPVCPAEDQLPRSCAAVQCFTNATTWLDECKKHVRSAPFSSQASPIRPHEYDADEADASPRLCGRRSFVPSSAPWSAA
jgi:hypothetical protein